MVGCAGHQKCTLESCFKALIISRVASKGSNGLSSVEPLHNGRLGDRRKWLLYRGLTFKPQYPHTNSPNWSPYISLKDELREFDKRSRHFYSGDHVINSHNLSVDSVWILLGENWSWSLLGLKGLNKWMLGLSAKKWGLWRGGRYWRFDCMC